MRVSDDGSVVGLWRPTMTDEPIPADELDALVAQLEAAGLVEAYPQDDGRSRHRLGYVRGMGERVGSMSREEFLRRRAEAAELGRKRQEELDRSGQGGVTILVPSPSPAPDATPRG